MHLQYLCFFKNKQHLHDDLAEYYEGDYFFLPCHLPKGVDLFFLETQFEL